MRGAVEQSVVERVEEDGDKEKKKSRRRSNRRSKQYSSVSVCGSVNEMRGELVTVGNGKTSNCATTSLSYSSSKPDGLEMYHSNEHGEARASDVNFNSMPMMHVNGQADLLELQGMQNQYIFLSDISEGIFSKSCPERIASEGPFGSYLNKDFLPPHQTVGYARRKYFVPHWFMDDVSKALENGDAFKAVFRVNAHNRLEAYCKINGVPTDVLINGFVAQNRAVEGDIVAVKVDPLSLWTRMKGVAGFVNNSALVEECDLLSEVNYLAGDSCKGKSKEDAHDEYGGCRNCSYPEKGLCYENNTFVGNVHPELNGGAHNNFVDGHHSIGSNSSHIGYSCRQHEVINSAERMCAMISSFPSKRPTGRVVAIIESSARRNAVVGFLNVKQWFSYREGYRKVAKGRSILSLSDRGYIQLTPTDPKFPKMMVLVRGLPECFRKRLEDGDATVERELVAAQIDDWGEESSLPQACILHTFGRGGEVKPQIEAILFENSICSSEFSPESISCLPCGPWVIPAEELQNRRDFRTLCTLTIDPSAATDLDDAVSVEKLSNGIFRVGVHIADVSYFVLPDTALDIEAQIRSTSVYMLQRKLPMLPPLLSENLGSLNPGVDRLTFSIVWDINCAGDVLDRWIGRTVIQSCCKLSYEDAQAILDGMIDLENPNSLGNGFPQLYGHFKWPDVIRSVRNLHEISKTLKEKRLNDGAIQLESSKIVFLFDENDNPYDSVFGERKDSNFLIEEVMLLANRTAAEVISRAFPDSALLRRHPEPNIRKLKEFESFCSKHGLELDTSSSSQFNKSLEQIRKMLKGDSVLFDILISYALRPMQLASYFCSGELKDKENDWGHYGLAVPIYTHFTSPLRRYPDIIVHRTLAAATEAEQLYSKARSTMQKVKNREEVTKCFSGIYFDKAVAESLEGRELLAAGALKHRVPGTELLADVAAYCNERKLASRHVKDACDQLYMWVLLKRKEILLSEARVLGLGPRFMSIYIQKLAIEQRIYYDEVEGLTVEWLEATSTLVLSLCANQGSYKRGSPGKCKALEDIAWVISPCELNADLGRLGDDANEGKASHTGDAGVAAQDLEPVSRHGISAAEIDPAVFPITVRLLSTIPVALHAAGGDDGPLEIGSRLYMSSYFR